MGVVERFEWADVVPEVVAKAQQSWERRQSAARMRECGLTFEQCGQRLGCSGTRARQLVERAERERRRDSTPPVMRWASCDATLVELGDTVAAVRRARKYAETARAQASAKISRIGRTAAPKTSRAKPAKVIPDHIITAIVWLRTRGWTMESPAFKEMLDIGR